MLISEVAYAAAYQVRGAESRVFDDIGCLLEAARDETGSDLRFWFHDASSREWIEGDRAAFVASAAIRTPMGGGILAYGDPIAAERAAPAYRGRVTRSITELLGRKGDSQ
jgi:hypothetical protein